MSKLSESIGRKLRKLRLQMDWLQKDVADRTGLTQGTISRAEDGKGSRKFEDMIKFADTYGLPLEYFRDRPADSPYTFTYRPN